MKYYVKDKKTKSIKMMENNTYYKIIHVGYYYYCSNLPISICHIIIS